jgi:hypothetical protein
MELKNYYNRARPKVALQKYDESFPSHDIKESKSLSYPSGHTAMAYFVANIIANDHPNLRSELETIAEMIGQSRIDNGVHYPTDVEFGRYIGELAASSLLNNEVTSNSLKSDKEVCQMFKDKANKDSNYRYNLAEFIRRSNEIERYHLDPKECLQAADDFIAGMPTEYCTQNKYIRSHLDALRKAASMSNIKDVNNIIEIHKCLGDDVIENENGAGIFRNFVHSSRSGVKYPDPIDITSEVKDFLKTNFDHPFAKHAHYEWIHPFCDEAEE